MRVRPLAAPKQRVALLLQRLRLGRVLLVQQLLELRARSLDGRVGRGGGGGGGGGGGFSGGTVAGLRGRT